MRIKLIRGSQASLALSAEPHVRVDHGARVARRCIREGAGDATSTGEDEPAREETRRGHTHRFTAHRVGTRDEDDVLLGRLPRGRTEGTSTSPSPEPVKPELERLAKLLRVNAYVELVGGAAVFANPSAVFPGLNAAGIEASQWYALTLGCVALASFLASKLDVHDEHTARSVAAPVVAGMTAYHLGISAFQVRRVATMGAVPVAVGALCVHGGLTIAFAVAAAYVLRPRSTYANSL